jgi:hypothetical protein
MRPRDNSRFHWQDRWLKAKTESFRLAMDALHKQDLGAVRHVTAACDLKGHWQLLVSTGNCRPLPSVDAEAFSIHYVTREPFQSNFERSRIGRFLTMLQQHGCHPRRIVTGTRTGPDMMVRLADGSPAIIEVKCARSANQVRELLAERYDYLLDTFKLFYASEYRSGCWHIWRVKRSGCEKVAPEALNG